MQFTREVTKGQLLERYAAGHPTYFLEFNGMTVGRYGGPETDDDGHELASHVEAELNSDPFSGVRILIRKGLAKEQALKLIDKLRNFVAATDAEDFDFKVFAVAPGRMTDDVPF